MSKKLSEQFLERISNSTQFSKPVVLSRHVKTYGEIRAIEQAIDIYNFFDRNRVNFNAPIKVLIQNQLDRLNKELSRIKLKENL